MNTIAVECGLCGRSVAAELIGQFAQHTDEDDWSVGVEIALVRCSYCGRAIVTSRWFEQWGDEKTDVDFGPHVRVWPAPLRELAEEAPAGVRSDYVEAQRCLEIGAYRAAALMARRLLEAIAVDLGATSWQLAAKLAELSERGVIDGRLLEWATALKEVGNEAAHNLAAPASREDATDALAFAEALADYVYTFRARFDRFKARREAVPGTESVGTGP